MEINRVFLDTSFFIRLFDTKDDPHKNALDYFKRFRQGNTTIYSSSIVAAEYGVKGNIDHLPLRFVQLQAFDIRHARHSAIFARTCFEARKNGVLQLENRVLIPNDTRIMAQAHVAKSSYLVGKDENAIKLLQFLNEKGLTACTFLDISVPLNEFFGELF